MFSARRSLQQVPSRFAASRAPLSGQPPVLAAAAQRRWAGRTQGLLKQIPRMRVRSMGVLLMKGRGNRGLLWQRQQPTLFPVRLRAGLPRLGNLPAASRWCWLWMCRAGVRGDGGQQRSPPLPAPKGPWHGAFIFLYLLWGREKSHSSEVLLRCLRRSAAFADSGQGSDPYIRNSGPFLQEGPAVLRLFGGLRECVFPPEAPRFALKRKKGGTGKARSQSTVCCAGIGSGWLRVLRASLVGTPKTERGFCCPQPRGGCWCQKQLQD